MPFTNLSRKEIIKNLVTEEYDVLIIGGGITGAGIALDAATRGMKTALVEMQDFASGTSSRSTKLVHGGLRYLKQLEVKMVAEVGKERAIVYENGPHVTKPEWMLLPIYQGGTFGKLSTSIGLRVYDFLAGVKKSERRRMLSKRESLDLEPLIKKEGLKGGGCYVEYRTDDARLTIEVIKKAVEIGVTAINYGKAEGFLYDNGQAMGIVFTDQLGNETYTVRAKKVVNAAGPWVDTLREKDHSKKGKQIRLSKGVHIVIDQARFPLKQAVYFDTQDGRMVFAIPRNRKTYIGTTDTFYNGDIANPKMTASDRSYIIDAINYMFPKVQIKPNDIESSWAGVRPLIFQEGKNPSEISRKDEIWVSESGLITIAGGKLTGYRKMAETVVDLLSEKLTEETGRKFTESHTRNIPISGGEFGGSKKFSAFINEQVKKGQRAGLLVEEAREIALSYGSNASVLYDIVQKKELVYNNKLPVVLLAKLDYAIQYEMVATPLDFFLRRTGDLLFNINDVIKNKDAVIEYMANQMGWTDEQKKIYFRELDYELYHARVPVD
ncbi:FAD-dependent oxidoreductase [Neobacillus rhizosphaerae]|uniref:glycerol-3-phosphate dehydrogenase/oxidase n=1 Tax=Neobacillus rhizosphaerae TaxID=2880965 RepID=UPI003D27489D